MPVPALLHTLLYTGMTQLEPGPFPPISEDLAEKTPWIAVRTQRCYLDTLNGRFHE